MDTTGRPTRRALGIVRPAAPVHSCYAEARRATRKAGRQMTRDMVKAHRAGAED